MADNDASEIDRREIILPTARFGDYAGVPTRLQKQVARFWRDRPNSFADRFGNFAGASVMRRSIVLPPAQCESTRTSPEYFRRSRNCG